MSISPQAQTIEQVAQTESATYHSEFGDYIIFRCIYLCDRGRSSRSYIAYPKKYLGYQGYRTARGSLKLLKRELG